MNYFIYTSHRNHHRYSCCRLSHIHNRFHRSHHCRRTYVSTSKFTASQDDHEKIKAWVTMSMVLRMAPLRAAGALPSRKCQLFTSQKVISEQHLLQSSDGTTCFVVTVA